MTPQMNEHGRAMPSHYAGRTVLAVGAHPDDLELSVGGTLARLSQAGARVVMAIVSVPGDVARRRAEALEGARILGAEPRLVLDGALRRAEDVKHYELVALVDALVRELEPALVITSGSSAGQRDHLLVHSACLPAQRLRQFDFLSYDPGACGPVPAPFHPRAYVDITAAIELKMQAIAAHASRFETRDPALEQYRDMARLNGRMVGVPYAEGLEVIRLLLT
jgi:N-acetylglucosamine malate deacetylase 1